MYMRMIYAFEPDLPVDVNVLSLLTAGCATLQYVCMYIYIYNYIYIRYYTIIYVQYVNDCIIIDIILREFRKPKKMLPVWSKSKLLCPSCFVELCIQPCQASKYWRAEKRATPQSIWSHAIWPICREVCGCSCCQFQCWAFQLISRCGAAAQHMCFSRPSRRTSGRILSLALKRRSSKLLQRLQER